MTIDDLWMSLRSAILRIKSFLLDKIILSLLILPYPGQEVPANYLLVR